MFLLTYMQYKCVYKVIDLDIHMKHMRHLGSLDLHEIKEEGLISMMLFCFMQLVKAKLKIGERDRENIFYVLYLPCFHYNLQDLIHFLLFIKNCYFIFFGYVYKVLRNNHKINFSLVNIKCIEVGIFAPLDFCSVAFLFWFVLKVFSSSSF